MNKEDSCYSDKDENVFSVKGESVNGTLVQRGNNPYSRMIVGRTYRIQKELYRHLHNFILEK